jgi:hypothetical protein
MDYNNLNILKGEIINFNYLFSLLLINNF